MNDMGYTEKEIEEGKDFMQMKEFWLVYSDDDNNCDLLQAILDTYYNEYPNTYSAEILHHQYSSRIIVQCNICNNIQLSSYDPFISHNNGKNHKKNVAERKDGSDNTMVDSSELVFLNMEDIDNPFEEGTLESDLFETSYDIIGYQFLYREIRNRCEFITCQLCARYERKYERMERANALRHMQSKFHQDNYLITKFDIKSSTLEDEHFRGSFIDGVIKKEGKLLHKILTIDKKGPIEESFSSKKKIKFDVGGEASSSLKDIKDPKNPETPEQFLEVIHEHLQHLEKNKGDNVITKLEKDEEAIDLLISTANVLAEKIYLFSQDYDLDFKKQAGKLLKRCEKIKLNTLEKTEKK